MLRAAIAFFVIGLLALLFGAVGIAGISLEIGKTILGIFVVLAVISYVVSLLGNKRSSHL
ncbi:MAG: DUF1328 domain-containing protein [Moraxellaceae bacterium]|nr:DUF1328 domain-containing protein [Pseudobdellovibrionaceae bacterium]